jgi:hypothetical protein
VLELANVPRSGIKLLISVKQHKSLLTQDEFINADYRSLSSGVSSGGLVGSVLGIPIYVSNSLSTNSTTGFYNGDSAQGAIASPTPGLTSSAYFPTQSPALRDGTSVTAATLTAGYDTAMLLHPDWAKLAMVKEPNVDAEWSTDYQEWHVVQTQVYDCEVYRPDHAVIINSSET